MNETIKKHWLRIIIIVAVLDIIVISAIFYFISPRGSDLIQWFVQIPRQLLVSIFIGFFIFFFTLALFLGLRDTRLPPPELVKLSQELGLCVCRKWGFEGSGGRISLFGYGPYFETHYRGNRLSYSTLMDDNCTWGARIALHHGHPLSTGLFTRYRASALTTPGRQPGEFKDIRAKRLDCRPEGLEAWSVDRQKAERILQNTEVAQAFHRFREAFEKIIPGDGGSYHRSGFIVNDKSITALVASPERVEAHLLESMHDLSNALTKAAAVEDTTTSGTC